MKKFALIVILAAMAVLDLVFAGIDIVLGLMIMAGVIGLACTLDKKAKEPRRTTSITKAARQTSVRQKEQILPP